MASGEATGLRRDLGLIAGSEGTTGLGDAELLKRFAGRRGDAAEAAFETIVAKHGPMVLGVCRGVLRQRVDADDAFQATFLVLVRKAGSVRVADSLGPWLYGVARRVATRARSDSARRRGRETSVEDADVAVSGPGDHTDALDARPILFEELDRLPEKYRSPVVLCHLEGLSHEEAARRLEWPVGTLSGRLSRARDLLRSRLARRGLGVGTALDVGAFLPPGAVPPELLRSTVQAAATFAAGGPVSKSIASLSQGVLTAMLIQKLKTALIAGSALTMLAVAAGYASGQIGGAKEAPPRENAAGPVPDEPLQVDQKIQTYDPKGPFPARDQLTIPMLASDSFVAVVPKGGRSVSAMAVDDGTWQEYRAPEGVSLTPVMSFDVLALVVSGDDVREVAALAAPSPTSVNTMTPRGTWVRQSLRRPVKGQLVPIVRPGMAFYQAGSDLYAFSATTNSWDTLHLGGSDRPRISGGRAALLVQQGETLHVFSISRGKWSEGRKVPEAAPRPAKASGDAPSP